MKNLFTLAITAAALGCSTGWAQDQSLEDPMQKPQKFERQFTRSVRLNYLLYLPKDYAAEANKRWPLMLFLHGAGERGSNVWKVAVHGPPKLTRTRKQDFPFIIVSPQCASGERWQNDALAGLLDEIGEKYRVDARRVYVTGLSMGGYGTWSLAAYCPDRFAAVAPICGGGETISVLLADPKKRAALKSLGVWAFHGAKDPVVNLEESERMVAAYKKAGCADARLTVYPEATHDSWTETYDNPELYDWLLKHSR